MVAYQVNSDDTGGASLSSGSTLLLPDHGLGTRHFAVSAPHAGADGQAFIAVVGTRAGTHVRITAAAATAAGPGVRALARGDTIEADLDDGDVLQIETAAPGDDLSGSEIVSDQPIAVFAGSVCGRIGRGQTDPTHDPGESGCDHTEEALYPVETWGKSFVFPDLRMPWHEPSAAVWGRIVASEDGTVVSFDAPATLAGVPATPVVLDRGQVFALEIREESRLGRRAHLAVTASAPIEILALMGTEEGAAVVTPVAQFRGRYLVSIHPWFTGNLFVARKAGTPVVVGRDLVPADLFLPAGGGFEIAQIEMPRCETDLSRCSVNVSGTELGVWVAADGGQCSYAYAGGAGVACVNRTVSACR